MSPLSRVARRRNRDRCSNGLCVCRCSVPEGRVSLVISPRTKEKRGRQPTRHHRRVPKYRGTHHQG